MSRTIADISPTQARPAAAEAGQANRSGSLPRFHIQIAGCSRYAPTTVASSNRSAAMASGSWNGLRYEPLTTRPPLTTWRGFGVGDSPSGASSHPGDQLGPLMCPVKNVMSSSRPRSSAASHTRPRSP